MTTVPAAAAAPRLTVFAALAAVYLVWGSTYFAIRIALGGFPPFALAAIRFLIAGGGLYAFLRLRGAPAPTRIQWRNAAFTGVLLLGFGNGLVCYAEQSVASGIAAVAVASVTLFAAVFSAFYGDWPRRSEWLGVLIGLAGVLILNFGGDLRAAPLGAAALVIAAGAWAYGSVWSRRREMPQGAMSTAAQMLTGGVALALMALLAGERFAAVPDVRAWGAFAYLVVFGSIVGFSAYIYLLRHVRPALATSYAYVNPPVAVLLGVALGGEHPGPREWIGMAVILAGVAFITLARQRR